MDRRGPVPPPAGIHGRRQGRSGTGRRRTHTHVHPRPSAPPSPAGSPAPEPPESSRPISGSAFRQLTNDQGKEGGGGTVGRSLFDTLALWLLIRALNHGPRPSHPSIHPSHPFRLLLLRLLARVVRPQDDQGLVAWGRSVRSPLVCGGGGRSVINNADAPCTEHTFALLTAVSKVYIVCEAGALSLPSSFVFCLLASSYSLASLSDQVHCFLSLFPLPACQFTVTPQHRRTSSSNTDTGNHARPYADRH